MRSWSGLVAGRFGRDSSCELPTDTEHSPHLASACPFFAQSSIELPSRFRVGVIVSLDWRTVSFIHMVPSSGSA